VANDNATPKAEKTTVCAKMPPIRNSRYWPPPGIAIAPPKTNANSNTNITGWMVASLNCSGWRRR
jgi:hypothetical protein